ncbi:MAG: thioredoxin family protein, partial [Pseudomonadota bacterium]
PWMVRLRQGLAFPMYASAAWLVWVLALQAGPNAVLAVLVGAVLLAFALWLAVPADGPAGRMARLAGGAFVLVAVALLAIPATSGGVRPASAGPGELVLGEPFAPDRLDEALGRGEAVFVHMTAAWCITCQVNEQVALSGDAFRLLLEQTDTTYLIGDWTNRDTVIADYLRRFDHPGVPLYVVYAAETGTARVLPQVLTPGIVRDALRAAARG